MSLTIWKLGVRLSAPDNEPGGCYPRLVFNDEDGMEIPASAHQRWVRYEDIEGTISPYSYEPLTKEQINRAFALIRKFGSIEAAMDALLKEESST